MTGRVVAAAKSAYQYPLIVKQLWHAPLLQAADQEIVNRDLKRFTYRELRRRVGRLASALTGIGVRPGDTVGVPDWDSSRFLEAFFAVPMMGVVLQTVNVRNAPCRQTDCSHCPEPQRTWKNWIPSVETEFSRRSSTQRWMRSCRLIPFLLRAHRGSRQVSFGRNANTRSGWASVQSASHHTASRSRHTASRSRRG
jgi:non-ribosomal peptide synthetase component E (peptide arylation enzyme)